MSIATQRTTPKERVTSSHKPDAPDSGADVAEAQAGAQSEAAKPRSGSRDNTKFVTPPAENGEKYDRNAEISRYIRRWKSKNLLWSQAFIDSGQSGKKKPNMRRVYDEVRRPAYCGQRANGYAKGVKVRVAKEHRRYRHGGHAELRLNESGRAPTPVWSNAPRYGHARPARPPFANAARSRFRRRSTSTWKTAEAYSS